MSFDLVEQRCLRRPCAAEQLGRHADVLFSVRAAHRLQLAEHIDAAQPIAKIGRDTYLRGNRGGHRSVSPASLSIKRYAGHATDRSLANHTTSVRAS